MDEKILCAGEEYIYDSNISEKKEVLKSFNELAKQTFGLWFDTLGHDYVPHVLRQGNRVVSNISVNEIYFDTEKGRKLYIQLGTVMTALDHRNKGLSRIIMERVLNEWKDQCDGIYLFANDSVLSFYPKFGFVKREEWECRYLQGESEQCLKLSLIDMEDMKNLARVREAARQGNPYSKLTMVENETVNRFYYEGCMRNEIYYIEEYQVFVIAALEDDVVCCYEILGKNQVSVKRILDVVAAHWNVKEVVLGFTPKNTEGMHCFEHKEYDCTLFVYETKEAMVTGTELMFPILTHA